MNTFREDAIATINEHVDAKSKALTGQIGH